MKLKVDENIGRTGVELLRQVAHDVATVRGQGLAGSPDAVIFEVCRSEARALLTLDRDFGQVHRFPPRHTAGIVVLDLGEPASLDSPRNRLREFLALAATRPLEGELWIVERGRVRVHLERDEED